ncbi:alpha/beta fold hydrolase [Haloarchaeobius amylolyticus]|uniref:alpha/beta fold hydrolase n=1 Tax=Haloarchaeobius amylolyticus TaxID=1198296 RepID=UPI0022719ADF|nr:alpha/beta hydrolase [Haloarchaeobius amylolyticus]
MEHVVNDGVRIAYEVDGPADAPVIAFCEGLGYGRWMWRFQRRRLEDYRTIVFDNRGTGDSDVPEPADEGEDPRYSIELFASDLEAVLDAEGVESAHVVGASMGGMTAQQYARDYDRAETLTLLCTSHGGEESVPTPESTQERMFEVPPEYDEREALRYKMQPAMSDDFWEDNDDLVEEIIDWRLSSDAPPEARLAQAGAVAAFDSTPWLEDLTIPAKVLHGTADRVLPVENGRRLHERLPESTLELYEHGSHLFFIESADAVTADIREHVESHAA